MVEEKIQLDAKKPPHQKYSSGCGSFLNISICNNHIIAKSVVEKLFLIVKQWLLETYIFPAYQKQNSSQNLIWSKVFSFENFIKELLRMKKSKRRKKSRKPRNQFNFDLPIW